VDEKTETGTRQTRAMSLSSWTSTDAFTFPVKVHSSLSSGGSTVFDVTNDVAYQASASWSGGDCGNLFQDGFVITVCNYHYGTINRSQVDVSSYDGRVTYFGTRYYKSYGFDGYATNYSADNPMGYSSYPVGLDVRTVVELTDARGTMFVSRPAMSLVQLPVLTQYSSCSLNRRTAVTFCSDGKTTGTTKSGSASDSSR
jgi:hypothetical protein